MLATPSLRRRIVAAFVLLAGMVAGLFALGMVITMDLTERNLASETMHQQIDFLLGLDGTDTRVELAPGVYYIADRDPRWEAWLDSLDDGFHDVYDEGVEAHVYLLTRDAGRHALVASLEEFERREEVMERLALIGFLASVAAALGLGLLTAQRVIAPVVRLSRQVQGREQLLALAPPLATDYADDEVGRLAATFDHALQRLRAALLRERLFTSDLSHEIRTPLMVIASSCELLSTGARLDSATRVQLQRIQRATLEMQETVDALLRLAREPSATESVEMIDLGAAAGLQHRRWRAEAVRRGLDLRLQGTTDAQRRYPAALLRTVLANLLRNALHYTERGFVAIELREAGFSIVDSGAGITSAQRDRVFAPFFRGDSARGDGIGIGLSLVQRVCEHQGWLVEVRTPDAGGCEFRVVLDPSDGQPVTLRVGDG